MATEASRMVEGKEGFQVSAAGVPLVEATISFLASVEAAAAAAGEGAHPERRFQARIRCILLKVETLDEVETLVGAAVILEEVAEDDEGGGDGTTSPRIADIIGIYFCILPASYVFAVLSISWSKASWEGRVQT